jgi:thiamine pyrophosphate-dependent acetolactate synthase large subunit-like protein
MINMRQFAQLLASHRKDEIVVSTMTVDREWMACSPSNPLDFSVIGAMGYACPVGIGLALAQPKRRVIVLDADGSLLMNFGTLVTLAVQSPPNLVHFVFENGIYEIAGRVPVPGCGVVSFTGVARAAGLKNVYEYDDLELLRDELPRLLSEAGPFFVVLKVEPGTPLPIQVDKSYRGVDEQARAMEKALALR